MKRIVLFTALALALSSSPVAAAGKKVTLESLLRQMTDLSLLAEYPDPPYVARQFSSYDRASEAPGRESWFANYDRDFTLYDGVVPKKTPYFKGGPTQGRAPDGFFAPGTKVGIAHTHRPVGEYVWAYATAPDGGAINGKIPQGYVLKSAIQMDPQGHVLAEMDGPGCVTRIWSANPNDTGNIRIYLDGAKKPVIDAPLLALLGGKWQTETNGKKWIPFPDPIACERSRGYNLYFPIGYAKHCKITIDRPTIYYHVDYRTYPKGTEVEEFSLERLAGMQEQLSRVQKDLAELPGNAHGDVFPQPLEKGFKRFEVKPGGKVSIASLEGPAAISSLRIYIEEAPELTQKLRSLVLVGRFDGGTEPQIECPLADFFGSGPGYNPYRSLPLTAGFLQKATFTKKRVGVYASHWVMPFARSAVFEVHNQGKEPVTLWVLGLKTKYRWTDRSMHFHARWRTQTMNTRPFHDWTYCDLKGKGVFVGDALSILNPVSAWWGEGDEKIYVDGEKFPSWFGTGSEDYYGYAWSDPKPFQHAYHNQTRCDGPGTRGWTSVNRFHILDAIPFTKSFRFDMEVWHWTPNINVTYAATSYWYARPGATDDFKPVEAKVLQNLPELPPPYRIPGALEGEKLKILKKSGNFPADPQDMAEFDDGGKNRWSGASHLWVRPPSKGAWVDLELPVAADGKYHLVVYLTKARDYGIIQFSLDGKPLGKPIDCFNPDRVVATGPIDLGPVELKKGAATLRGEVVGTNPRSDGLRYMWGLDCVVLRKGK